MAMLATAQRGAGIALLAPTVLGWANAPLAITWRLPMRIALPRLLLGVLGTCAVAAWAAEGDHAGHKDHAGHAGHGDHSGHAMSTERDAEGRRLWGQTHAMTPAMYDELREKVPLYRNASKAVMDMSMVNMGAEYQWYVSPTTVRNEAGVLIMTHGFREQGDRLFKSQLGSLAGMLPTSLSLGMGMMMSDHVQLSIDDLEAAGVKTIVVVPALSTRYNELMRQWEYIFGRRNRAEFVSVKQVKPRAELLLANPPEDDPLVGEILLDHAREISSAPDKELVIIVAHGASGAAADEDNPREMKILETLGRYIKEDGGFADVQAALLQDDAPAEQRAANVARLRAVAQKAVDQGRTVLIVTNLIGARTLQPKLRSDLKGIEFKFNTKGIAQHPNFIEWIEETVRHQLEQQDAKRSAGNR
jgi:sirohydrochlorin cobaltochelatase